MTRFIKIEKQAEVIKMAFNAAIYDKLKVDGYINMTRYVKTTIIKQKFYERLASNNSKFKNLFHESQVYPDANESINIKFYEILKIFRINISEYIEDGSGTQLTPLEADAIVYWFFRSFKNKDDRILFSRSLFEFSEDIVQADIEDIYIFYNNLLVDINVISSLKDYVSNIENLGINGPLYYRGHDNVNYMLKPSIFREQLWLKNESNIFEEIQIQCPEDFIHAHTHLEKLVKMQHYNIPTRLLDITRNPLVALYFACLNSEEVLGEVIVFGIGKYDVKYPKSDTVSVLSSLAALSHSKKAKVKQAFELSDNDKEFNQMDSSIVNQVRLEKPTFEPKIIKENLMNVYIVNALKNNNRIIKQDGAFIVYGLDVNEKTESSVLESINELRYRDRHEIKPKIPIFLIMNKESILRSLNSISINESELFPEIDSVAKTVKGDWSKLVW